MSAVFRVVLILLIAVTLPTQVLAGVAMPFCAGQGGSHAATTGNSTTARADHGSPPSHTEVHAGHVHDVTPQDPADHDGLHAGHAARADAGVDPHAGHAAGDPATASGSGGCDQCGLCQLACASALPVSVIELRCELRTVLQPAPVAGSTAFLPDTLLRPPRAASC